LTSYTRRAKNDFNVEMEPGSIVSALTKKVNSGRMFRRVGPSTFEIAERLVFLSYKIIATDGALFPTRARYIGKPLTPGLENKGLRSQRPTLRPLWYPHPSQRLRSKMSKSLIFLPASLRQLK